MNDDVPKRRRLKVKSSHTIKRQVSPSWVLTTVLLTFILSIAITVVTTWLFSGASVFAAALILLFIILIGILFDIIGLAVATAAEAPFHAMASKRVPGAVRAIALIRNAEKVSNFCNDVIGDICGIISGATGSFIAAELVRNFSMHSLFTGLIITGTVSALTVGGKALGKTLAINQCNQIVYFISRFLTLFQKTQKKRI